MRPYPNGRLLRRVCLLSPFVAMSFVASSIVHAQHRLMIPDPLEGEEKLEVVGFEGTLSVADLGFGFERVASSRYYFEEASSYAEGYLEINRPTGKIIQDVHRAKFDFELKVKPSRDFVNCFLVLQLFTKDGRELLLPHEIDDLMGGVPQTVSIEPNLAFGDLDRGIYYYYFFSEGEEIYYAPTQFSLGKKRQRPITMRDSGDCEPELRMVPETPLPERLVGLVSGEEVLVSIGVNDSGYSVDHFILSATNNAAARMATNLVKRARFTPGAENGFFVRKDMLLRVQFDSRGEYEFEVE